MEGASNKESGTDAELIKKIAEIKQNLHKFKAVVLEWKAENNAQRERLDQMDAEMKETITTIESVAENMLSSRKSSVQTKSSAVDKPSVAAAADPVRKLQNFAHTVQIKMENRANDAVVQSNAVPNQPATKQLVVQLQQIHPIEIKKEIGMFCDLRIYSVQMKF